MEALARTIATFFGTGYLRPAPGTWGSAAATLLLCLLGACVPGTEAIILRLFLLVVTTCAGVWAVSIYLTSIRSTTVPRDSSHKGEDPSEVVIDEAAGVLVSALLLPWSPVPLLLAFALFRVFDITKPFPVNALEKLPGAWGVMADDLAAGLYALVFAVFIFFVLGHVS